MKRKIAGVVSLLLLAGALVGAAAVLSTPNDLDVTTKTTFVKQTITVGQPLVRNETEFSVVSRVTVVNEYDVDTTIRQAQEAQQ